MRSLFRVVGEERGLAGSTILRRVASEITLLDEVRDYVLDRVWGIEIIEGQALPKPPRHIPAGDDRDRIDQYRTWLEQGRPIEPVLMSEDGIVLVGWHRAVAAREANKRLAAYVPRRLRRKRRGA